MMRVTCRTKCDYATVAWKLTNEHAMMRIDAAKSRSVFRPECGTQPEVIRNTANSVGLRVKPDKTSAAIRRLQAGDRLQVIAAAKTWSKVLDPATGRTGYVANDYIVR